MQINKTHLKDYLKLLYIANNRVDHGFSKKSNTSSRWIKQFFSSAVVGLLSMFMLAFFPNFQFASFLFFIILMITLITSFLSEYSNILLDTKDNNILFHHPISSQTVFTGRLIYIIAVALFSGLSICFPSILYMLFAKGALMGLGFFFASILAIFTSVSLALFLYILLFKFLGGERLKDIINYIQIGFSVVFISCFYLSDHLFDVSDIENIIFTYEWWAAFVPPLWQVAFIDVFSPVATSVLCKLLAAIALFFPIVIGLFSYKHLASVFKTEMVKFDIKEQRMEKKKSKLALSVIYAKLFTINKLERSLFSLYNKLFSRDRSFKMMVYPAVAYSLVLPLIKILKANKEAGLSVDTSASVYLTALYYSSMLFITAVLYLSIGDYGNVSDIYKAAPLKKTGFVLSSSLKVLNYNFFLIPLFISSVFITYVWGWTHLLSVVTVFLSINIVGIFALLASEFKFPLSLPKAEMSKTSMGVMIFLVMILLGFLGLMHYYILMAPYGLIIYTSLLAIGYLASLSALRSKSL